MRERTVAETVARYYAGRTRNWLSTRRHRRSDVRLSGVSRTGRAVVLRRPQFGDASEWRRLRIRDQEFIEPYWVSSDLTWSDRHTEAVWIRECLRGRAEAVAGNALPLVIEVDGEFAGQCNLEWIDHHNSTGELGIWLDSTLAKSGVALTAINLLVGYAFDELGLQRVSAPISAKNNAARAVAAHLGSTLEGTMHDFMDVGGHRSDHELWAITSDRFTRKHT